MAGSEGQGVFWAHETAVVDEPTTIGSGTKVWHFCHVMSGARIGQACVLGQNVFVGARAVVGDRCKIQNNVSLYDEVILEDDVFIGPSAVFTNVINPRALVERKKEYLRTVVGQGASVGANATVVCGNTIGTYAFIGAGAVVTKDVPAYALMMGVPTKRVGWICRCGERLVGGLNKTWHCRICSARYVNERGEILVPETEV